MIRILCIEKLRLIHDDGDDDDDDDGDGDDYGTDTAMIMQWYHAKILCNANDLYNANILCNDYNQWYSAMI